MAERTPDQDERDRGERDQSETVDESRRRIVTWLWRLPVLAVIGGVGFAAYEAYKVQFSKGRPAENPVFAPRPAQRVGDLSEFPELWSELEFVLGGVPAVALRLPEPVSGGVSVAGQHYAAFSRVCTHQGCIVALNRNLEAIAVAFNYRTDSPALACPCHFSVFDPERAGAAVSGPAVRPLPRVALNVQDGALYAVGLEG